VCIVYHSKLNTIQGLPSLSRMELCSSCPRKLRRSWCPHFYFLTPAVGHFEDRSAVSRAFLDVGLEALSKCDRGILRLRRILITVNLVLSGGLAASSLGAPAQRRCYGAVGGFHPASTFAGLAHSSSATRVLQPPLCGRVLASLSPRTACDHVPLSLLLRLPAPARPYWPRPSVKNESAITGTCTRRTHCSACHPVSSFCWLLVGDGTGAASLL